MAITTDNGKLGVMEWDQDYEPGLPLSPGTLGQDDQQQLLWGFPEVLWGQSAAEATSPGGSFRRRGDTGRVFRRKDVAMMTVVALPKDEDEVVVYCFDFQNFPEVEAGETIESISISDDPTNPGELSISAGEVNAAEFDDTPAGAGVLATVSGGEAGTTYRLKCKVTTSGGSERVVKGDIEVE